MSNVNDCLDELGKGYICSTLDCASGFHQINVKKSDQYKTGFSTRSGVYTWRKMPFGLINAPFTFQKIMNTVFKEFL